VGSIPTRSRHPFPGTKVLVTALLFGGVHAASAQVPIPRIPTSQTPDTTRVEPFRVKPPVSPLGAMARSLLFPGWGQAVLKRRVTGAIFVAWEGVTLGMTLKSQHQLAYMRRINSDAADSKKQELQDWLVLLVFNHLFSAAEAFVSANLWDFPDDIRVATTPNGGVAVVASLRFP